MPSPQVLAGIVFRTGCIYIVVLLGVRLTGKREVGQMTPFDLTLLLLLSNAVQNAMTGPDVTLLGGVTAAITLLVLNYVIAEYSGINRRFRRLVQGSPALLVHNGELVMPHLAKEHVTVDEVQRALREHGISSISDVALGVLEVDGSISLLKYDDVPNVHPEHRLKFLHKKQ